MVKEKEVRAGDAVIVITETEEGITVLGTKGQPSRVVIPERIDGIPVTVIAKKAFLGNKVLTEISLPDSVREIGDWAFAHCSSLYKIKMPSNDIYVGKDICKGCKLLRFVDTGNGEEAARLFAAVPVMLDAAYLFVPTEVGSAEWLAKWDDRMLTLLFKNDESGFTRLVLCGEEDLLADLPAYVVKKRREKAEMCFLRLLNPTGLSEETENKLQEYLHTHTKGCDSEAAWEALLFSHGDERAYYEEFMKAGCVTEENITDMLADMKDGHTEMKALLIRYQEEQLGKRDFFDSLSLD